MGLCDKCINKIKTFHEYEGWRVKCAARWQTILPDPLMSNEIQKVIRTGECPFFNKHTRLDKDGFPYVVDELEDEARKRGFI